MGGLSQWVAILFAAKLGITRRGRVIEEREEMNKKLINDEKTGDKPQKLLLTI